MGASENKEAVLEYFSMVGGGEEGAVQRAVERFREDAIWHLPPSLPNGGSYRGRQAIIDMLNADEGMALYEPGSMKVQAEAMIADDDYVVVPLVLRAVTRHGEPYENRYVFVYRLENSEIVEVWENLDTLYLHRAIYAKDDA